MRDNCPRSHTAQIRKPICVVSNCRMPAKVFWRLWKNGRQSLTENENRDFTFRLFIVIKEPSQLKLGNRCPSRQTKYEIQPQPLFIFVPHGGQPVFYLGLLPLHVGCLE